MIATTLYRVCLFCIVKPFVMIWGMISSIRGRLTQSTRPPLVSLICNWMQGRSLHECFLFYQMKRTVRNALPALGRRMVDDGVLEILRDTPNSGGAILQGYRAECKHPKDLDEVTTSFNLLNKLRRIQPKTCLTCLYRKSRCVCESVTKVKPYHNIWVFQSVGEFGRNNNSGSLLCLITDARRSFRGIQEQENELLQHIQHHSESTVVVFPSDTAITVQQYQHHRKQNGLRCNQQLNFILLDGTPGEAATMDRFLPSIIPRVRLNEIIADSWLHSIRGQSHQGRVCTAQGAIVFARDGGIEEYSAIESYVRNLVAHYTAEKTFWFTNNTPPSVKKKNLMNGFNFTGKFPWTILGVGVNATPEEVHNAYRKLALRCHPDQNGGCTQALDSFQQIKDSFDEIQRQ